MFDALARFLDRWTSAAYDPVAVLFELALIGLAVNWCASVLHGTRGTRLLRGLIVVLIAATLIVQVLSLQQGWTRLELLYRYTWTGLLFGALVAFQPEIRRAFIQAGDVRLLRRTNPQSRAIAALVESARFLSSNRYGALIAIQRDVGLRNWAENGVRLDADVSASLLNSIFFPNSPLHDMGVIIHDNRILAAGCPFPLAESGEVDTTLGSRHRAAIGLSSESDALVIVISEETGTISLADRGMLTRFLSLDDLQEQLTVRLGGGAERRPFGGRKPTLSDTWRIVRRLLAVVPLSLIIWFLADQASQIEAGGFNVKVNALPATADRVADWVEPSNGRFNVTLRGPTRVIERLRARSGEMIEADWTLTGEPNSRQTVDAAGTLDRLPALRDLGVTVVSAAPATMTVQLEELVTENLPVRLDSGSLQVQVARIEPPTAQITMRRRDFEQLPPERRVVQASLTDHLQRTDFDGEVTLRAPLSRTIEGFEVVSVSPSAVDVVFRIVGARTHRKISNVPVLAAFASVQLQQQYQIEQRDPAEWLIEVEVVGERSRVEALSAQNVLAIVRITSDLIRPGDDFRSVAVTLDLPDGVALSGPPPTVSLRLTERPAPVP